MLKERARHVSDREGPEGERMSHVKTLKTAAGPLFLRSCCPPALIEGLRADEGL